jgi:hypothetical protein
MKYLKNPFSFQRKAVLFFSAFTLLMPIRFALTLEEYMQEVMKNNDQIQAAGR